MKFKSKRRDVSRQRDQFFSNLPYEMQEYILLEVYTRYRQLCLSPDRSPL